MLHIQQLAQQFRDTYGLDTDDFISLGEARCNFHDALHQVFGLAPTTDDEVLVTLLENYFIDGSRLPRRGKLLVSTVSTELLELLSEYAQTL